jgi:NAD(P)-dependent dehydrogenase (short-subunit alcohol dehydrogenase family)
MGPQTGLILQTTGHSVQVKLRIHKYRPATRSLEMVQASADIRVTVIDTNDHCRRLRRCHRDAVRPARRGVRQRREQQGFGSIVNVSSIGGLRGSSGTGAYQASEHAVIGLTRTAAHDFGPLGIRVNVLAPGLPVDGGFVA